MINAALDICARLVCYLAKAVETLRAQGMEFPDDYLQHLSPLGWEHIVLTGDYHWDLEQATNLERLRPLRVKDVERGTGA